MSLGVHEIILVMVESINTETKNMLKGKYKRKVSEKIFINFLTDSTT